MKKSVCLLFLVSVLFAVIVGFNKDIDDLIIHNVSKIQLIMDGDGEDLQGVFNGDKMIVDVDSFSQIDDKEVEGITITMDNYKFDIVGFVLINNIIIDNMYCVGDSIVCDCKIVKSAINGFSTMQIVINERSVIIGVPMILNSF